MLIFIATLALFLVGAALFVCECCRDEQSDQVEQPDQPEQPTPKPLQPRECKALLPEGVRLVQLANGNFRAVFPCGTEFPAGGEGVSAEQCIRTCRELVETAKRQRDEIKCEGVDDPTCDSRPARAATRVDHS